MDYRIMYWDENDKCQMERDATPQEVAEIEARTILATEKKDLEVAEQAVNDIKSALREIDIASIRSMRECLAALPDAPQFLKDHESRAQAERAKLAVIDKSAAP